MKNNNYKQFTLFSCLLIPLHLSLFFPHMIIHVAGYEPSYTVTLNCGSAGNSMAQDDRKWQGDMSSKFIPQEQNNNASVTSIALVQASSVDPVPYMTARIFQSQFNYSFPVPPGPKFIRLHFYPALYPNFNATKAFFSVKVGTYTFLSNFSAFLTARSLHSESFFKEFCINVAEESQWLNITFDPSSKTPDGYAFINGIEIVSMPDNLYYSTPSDHIDNPIIGQSSGFPIENTTAMEMVYRLNVGGQHISAQQDTGMFRSWSIDDDFLSYKGVNPSNTTMRIKYSDEFPPYLAPEEVYQTARTMGMRKDLNNIINLTWSLPVYLGFNYLVRLHFCEFSPNITKSQDREFHIFIDQQIAEKQADVITWSGSNGAATYRDYVVMLQRGSQSKHVFDVELHPNPESRTGYSDAILNGLELFKISTAGTGNLAGPNPEPDSKDSNPTLDGPSSPQPGHQTKSKSLLVFITAGSVLGGVVALSVLGFFLLQRRRRAKEKNSTNGTASSKTKGSRLPSDLCHHFTLVEIRKATDDFNDNFLIGFGGFGNVYKGYMNMDGGEATAVAIKRLNPGSQQGAHEFQMEIEMLSKLRHLHLVSLVGYCNDEQQMILVYDYMAQGTLRDHLYKTDKLPLSWKRRLEICIGAARGLHYLHTGAKYSIIHRDVKTTNILLDEEWVAKVSDFGLSRVGPTTESKTHVSTVVKGSFGYMDPEYIRLHQLTEKSDVYSFGVVLFEVLCARPPLVQNLIGVAKEQVNLAEWGRHCYQNGTLHQIIDPHLMGKIAPECLHKFGEIAVSCLHDEGIKRPSMNDVVWTLEFVLQLQESAEERIKLGGDQPEITIYSTSENDLFASGNEGASDSRSSGVTTVSNGGVSFASSGSEGVIAGAVFSEIMNSKGR